MEKITYRNSFAFFTCDCGKEVTVIKLDNSLYKGRCECGLCWELNNNKIRSMTLEDSNQSSTTENQSSTTEYGIKYFELFKRVASLLWENRKIDETLYRQIFNLLIIAYAGKDVSEEIWVMSRLLCRGIMEHNSKIEEKRKIIADFKFSECWIDRFVRSDLTFGINIPVSDIREIIEENPDMSSEDLYRVYFE